MKAFFEKWKSYLILIGCGLASAVGFYGFLYFKPEYSLFAAKLMMVFVAVGIFVLIDMLIPEIDTIKELRDGNVAYAIFLLAIAILIAAAIGGAV